MRTITSFVRPMLILFGLATVSGCFSPMPLRRDIEVQMESKTGLIIQSARVRQTKEGVMVSGTVRRARGYAPTYRSHLDIAFLNSDGTGQRVVATRYFPVPPRRSRGFPGRSSYAIEISEVVPEGSAVRVSHHATAIRECPHNSPTERSNPDSARIMTEWQQSLFKTQIVGAPDDGINFM